MVLGEEVDADADDDADEGRERLRVDFILMSRTGYLLGVDILTAKQKRDESNARLGMIRIQWWTSFGSRTFSS